MCHSMLAADWALGPGKYRSTTAIDGTIRLPLWNFFLYFRQMTVPDGLITLWSVGSQFLLEDAMDFKIF
jgi:hypothetical protein